MPILELRQSHIAIYEDKFIIIDNDYNVDLFEYHGQTPQELWDNVIKPDLEWYTDKKYED